MVSLNKTMALLAMATALALPAPAAMAGSNCATQAVVAKTLKDRFGETARYFGKTDQNYVVEVYASEGFETWTLTLRHAKGPTCIISSGTGSGEAKRRWSW